MKKQTNIKIRVGSVVKSKVGELDNITREEKIRRMKKEVVGCVKSVVGKKTLLFQFEDSHKKENISSLLFFKVHKMRLRWMSQYYTSPKKNKANC